MDFLSSLKFIELTVKIMFENLLINGFEMLIKRVLIIYISMNLTFFLL